MNEQEPYTTGNFEVRRRVLSPVNVDCSTWVDTSDGEWTVGSFEVRRHVLPPIHVDCSKRGRDEATEQVELVVEGAADEAVVVRLLDAIGRDLLEPEPATRTERLPDGDTLAVLTLARPTSGESPFAEVIRRARAELDKPGPGRHRLKRASVVFAA